MAVQYISFQFSLQSVLSVFSSFPLLCTRPYTPVLLYYLQTYLVTPPHYSPNKFHFLLLHRVTRLAITLYKHLKLQENVKTKT